MLQLQIEGATIPKLNSKYLDLNLNQIRIESNSKSTKKPLIFRRPSVYSFKAAGKRKIQISETWLFKTMPNGQKKATSFIAYESEEMTVYQFFETLHQENIKAYYRMRKQYADESGEIEIPIDIISPAGFQQSFLECLRRFPTPVWYETDIYYKIGEYFWSPVPDGDLPNVAEFFATGTIVDGKWESSEKFILYLKIPTSTDFFEGMKEIKPQVYNDHYLQYHFLLDKLWEKFGVNQNVLKYIF